MKATFVLLLTSIANARSQITPNVCDIQIKLYTKVHEDGILMDTCSPTFSNSSVYDSKKHTYFFIPGLPVLSGDASEILRDALIAGCDSNIFIVEWSNVVEDDDYWNSHVDKLLQIIGAPIGKFVRLLIEEQKISARNITIIGHGFGAHLAGVVGHITTNPEKIGTIIGLDPQAPEHLMQWNKEYHIDESDANYVMIVHTSSFSHFSAGHIGFFPNGGQKQPGCAPVVARRCSHQIVAGYFAESVRKPGGFLSKQCDSFTSYRWGKCDDHDSANLGLPIEGYRPEGDFYLSTREFPPYSLQ